MIHSLNYYDAACFSGVSNESLSTKVPIYELSACSYLGFPVYPIFLLVFHYLVYKYIGACSVWLVQCSITSKFTSLMIFNLTILVNIPLPLSSN